MSKKEKLTDGQIKFCQEYIIDWNGTRAYRAAYPNTSTDQVAASNASRMLRNDKVKAYIEEIQNELEKQAGLSALRNLNELKKLAYGNISKLKKNWHTLKDWDDLTDEEKACIQEITTTTRTDQDGNETTVVKIKLHDKIKPIEIINRMLGYNEPEELNVNNYEIDWRE